jgi:hypothetical protein
MVTKLLKPVYSGCGVPAFLPRDGWTHYTYVFKVLLFEEMFAFSHDTASFTCLSAHCLSHPIHIHSFIHAL